MAIKFQIESALSRTDDTQRSQRARALRRRDDVRSTTRTTAPVITGAVYFPTPTVTETPAKAHWWVSFVAWLASFGPPAPAVEASLPVVVEPVYEPFEEEPVYVADMIGATDTHYRAFSLLQPRVTSDDSSMSLHKSIVAFRDRTKTIRQLRDREVNDSACAVLNTFVALVDAFTPLWDAAGKAEDLRIHQIGTGARVDLRDDILGIVAKLDAELARVLSGESAARDRFETVQRFVDLRYGASSKSDYGLTSV